MPDYLLDTNHATQLLGGFGLIQAEQKTKGRPIPPIDAQIAAVALLRNLVVLTADHHFEYVDRLTVENWLA